MNITASWNVAVVLIVASFTLVWGWPPKEDCKPSLNCLLPSCRCLNDKSRPGNVSRSLTPQMVLLTFSYGINDQTVGPYLSLFEGLYNPNNCQTKGTFFVQSDSTEETILRLLYDTSHEMALTVANDRLPHSELAWTESLLQSMSKLKQSGVPTSHVHGVRGPEMTMGGDLEMTAMRNLSMTYEAGCLNYASDNLLWPFTYDFNKMSRLYCRGTRPRKNYPGLWQFPVAAMKYKGHLCSTLEECSWLIRKAKDAEELLYETFIKHYTGTRAPMVIFVHPDWMSKKEQVNGLSNFLKRIRKAHKDTWILTMSQALQWVKYPVPMYESVKFLPWECHQDNKYKATKKATKQPSQKMEFTKGRKHIATKL